MNTIKTLLLIVAVTCSSVLMASTGGEKKEAKSVVITEEIGKLLNNPSFELDKEVSAMVTLTINKNNEIVVLSVETEEDYLVNFIKSRLNYNELSEVINTNGKTFKVPVRITPEE